MGTFLLLFCCIPSWKNNKVYPFGISVEIHLVKPYLWARNDWIVEEQQLNRSVATSLQNTAVMCDGHIMTVWLFVLALGFDKIILWTWALGEGCVWATGLKSRWTYCFCEACLSGQRVPSWFSSTQSVITVVGWPHTCVMFPALHMFPLCLSVSYCFGIGSGYNVK